MRNRAQIFLYNIAYVCFGITEFGLQLFYNGIYTLVVVYVCFAKSAVFFAKAFVRCQDKTVYGIVRGKFAVIICDFSVFQPHILADMTGDIYRAVGAAVIAFKAPIFAENALFRRVLKLIFEHKQQENIHNLMNRDIYIGLYKIKLLGVQTKQHCRKEKRLFSVSKRQLISRVTS